MKSVQLLDYLVIIVYMVISLGVGFYFMKFNKGASDYFKGGNKIPWLVSGLSAFMTGFSAWTFTGASGIAYEHGMIVILLYFGNALTFIFGYFLFAVRWRRARISSPMEYLSQRFDDRTRQTFAFSTVFFDLFMVAVWLYALGEFVSVATQIPVSWVIIVSAAIILVYCLLGGLWAVVITDFIQGIILLPFTIILAYASIERLGGISKFIEAMPADMLHIGHSEYSSWIFVVSWTIMVIFGYNTRAHAQRYYSVDTEKSAKKIAVLNLVLFLVGASIWFIPPMAAKVLYPNIAELWSNTANAKDGAYAVISMTILPHGLIGVMLAVIFSASMSNISGFYNLFASIISLDLIPKLYNKQIDEKKLLLTGRLATLGIGIIVPVIALIMSQTGESTFELLIVFNSIISIAYGPPALLGLIKKTPHWTGLVTFVVALILGSIGWFWLGWGIPENVFYVIPISIIIMLGGNIIDKRFVKSDKKYEEKQELFFKKLDTPIDIKNEVGSPGNVEFIVFSFLAKVTIFIAVLSLLFLLFNGHEGSSIIVLYSFVTLAMGLILYLLGLRSRRIQRKMKLHIKGEEII